jgi:hypothetical protein
MNKKDLLSILYILLSTGGIQGMEELSPMKELPHMEELDLSTPLLEQLEQQQTRHTEQPGVFPETTLSASPEVVEKVISKEQESSLNLSQTEEEADLKNYSWNEVINKEDWTGKSFGQKVSTFFDWLGAKIQALFIKNPAQISTGTDEALSGLSDWKEAIEELQPVDGNQEHRQEIMRQYTELTQSLSRLSDRFSDISSETQQNIEEKIKTVQQKLQEQFVLVIQEIVFETQDIL